MKEFIAVLAWWLGGLVINVVAIRRDSDITLLEFMFLIIFSLFGGPILGIVIFIVIWSCKAWPNDIIVFKRKKDKQDGR